MIQSDFLHIKEYSVSWCVFIWGSAIPCYIALAEFFKIAQAMEAEDSFSRGNAVRLQRIAMLSLGDTAYFFIGSVVFLVLNMSHPMMVILCMVILIAGVGITMANISILKNGKAKAIKLDTLDKICKALGCQPGDILEWRYDLWQSS